MPDLLATLNRTRLLFALTALVLMPYAIEAQPTNRNEAPSARNWRRAGLCHSHAARASGRSLTEWPHPIAFEENGMLGIPIYESSDNGDSWQFVTRATDGTNSDHEHCNLHWQPQLTEMPRTSGPLPAGTILLSASAVCTSD